MFAKITLGLALALAATAATADQRYVNVEQRLTQEQMRATGLDGLSKAQLELLNRLLSEDTAKVVEAAKAEEAKVQEEKHAKAQEARVAEAEARNAAGDGSGSLLGLDDKPVKSRLKGSVSGWEPGTVFELENGQQWKVLKGSLKLRKTLDAPEVIVVGGFGGRFFLQVDEDMPKARVYLIN